MLDTLISLDQSLLLWFNGSNSLYLDQLAQYLTAGPLWAALYVALLHLVVKNNETMGQIALVVGGAALCILLADGLADGIVKPLVGRLRPSNDPYIKYLVEVVGNRRGSGYSFFSAHAANTMSLAVFFALLVRNRMLTVTLVVWSLINCWTRLYLGFHYPSDILCGLCWGVVAGGVSYFVFHKFYYKISPKINYISSQYTSTGYAKADIDIVMLYVVVTVAIVSILSLRVF